MIDNPNSIEVYLEIGRTRTFATAIDWPGWCRSGRDEASALQSLCDYGRRYKRALQTTQLGFRAPEDASDLIVVERQTGNTTTDFGAPDLSLPNDTKPITSIELERWGELLRACWRTFDATVQEAAGKELKKGPRGGGRELSMIVRHVRDVDITYLSVLGGKVKIDEEEEPVRTFELLRQTILTTLTAAANGEVPAYGPRGGARWTPRFFVRRLAWHELDHAWEIEDRITE